MAAKSNRLIFIGTSDGVFLTRGNGDGYQARPCGLQGRGAVRSMLADAKNPGRVYATSNKTGFWRSDDAGQTWQEINEGIIYKEAWSLAQDSKTGTLYGGTGPASVFKSFDGGDTWIDCDKLRALPETIDWSFPTPPHVAHVKGLDVCSNRVLGAVEEGWIVRSMDGGDTWEDIKAGTYFDAHYVVTMPDDPNVVIHSSGGGVFKSRDGGQSFADAMVGIDRYYMGPVIVHPNQPNVLFTASAAVPPHLWRREPEGADRAVYRSVNQGDYWKQLFGGLPEVMTQTSRALAFDPDDPDVVLVGTLPKGSVWMTEDGGESFRTILDGLPPVNCLIVVPI